MTGGLILTSGGCMGLRCKAPGAAQKMTGTPARSRASRLVQRLSLRPSIPAEPGTYRPASVVVDLDALGGALGVDLHLHFFLVVVVVVTAENGQAEQRRHQRNDHQSLHGFLHDCRANSRG